MTARKPATRTTVQRLPAVYRRALAREGHQDNPVWRRRVHALSLIHI